LSLYIPEINNIIIHLMKLEEAVRLISNEFVFIPQSKVWRISGCGSGIYQSTGCHFAETVLYTQ
jgi:hypothetical protein